MTVIDPEVQARQYRDNWRKRMLAHAARERSLRGQSGAWRQNLINWRPLIEREFAIPVGDENDEQERGTIVNG